MTEKEWSETLTEAKKFCPESVLEKIDKIFLKIKTESYDKGYKSGANQKDNKPCLCGFWGKK